MQETPDNEAARDEAFWLLVDMVAVLMEHAASGAITQVGVDAVDTSSIRLQRMAHEAGRQEVWQRLATARGQFQHRFGARA